jgi:hypothetical protein
MPPFKFLLEADFLNPSLQPFLLETFFYGLISYLSSFVCFSLSGRRASFFRECVYYYPIGLRI